MRIEPFSLHAEARQVIADWIFDEWGHRKSEVAHASIAGRLERELAEPALPESFVAVEGERFVGFSSLKAHEISDIYPDWTPWLGNVYVNAPMRDRGIGTALAERAEERARELGYHCLHLQTEQHDGGI